MCGDSAVTVMETTEKMNHNSDKLNSKDVESTEIESQILTAMRSRVTYLRDKAESFTIESVRRLLEEDMGLEKYALDLHKSFVKERLVQCLEDAGNDGISENSQETERKDDATRIEEEHEAKNDVLDKTGDEGNKEALMSDIRRALRERTSYIKANSEEITLASLRRLLEQDLKLEKHSLDPFKKFINKELDDVLEIPDAPKRSTEPTVKNPKKKVKSTPSKKKLGSEENSDSDAEGDVDDEQEDGKKEMVRKRKLAKSEMTRKRKSENGKLVSGKKKAKHTETDSENDSDAGDNEMIADNGHSQSSSVKSLKQTKETATTVYGKRVEHLKSVIKSCGMSVPPSIYRKAKQAPEEKREATLIEELEKILSKEGLSSDPSEQEIKEVKKRKDILKELEGIDTSNIVSSSRRRSTTSFVLPPKPKITAESESESDEPEESENEEDIEEDKEVGNEEAEEGSQSEQEESNNEDDGGEESE